jgi:hypothetical protein
MALIFDSFLPVPAPSANFAIAILFTAPGSCIVVNLVEQSLLVTGSEEFIVAIAQQIAWITSACRVSPLGLGYSYVTFQETSPRFDVPLRTFHIANELCPLTSDDPGSCWNEIVGNSTIATGFPIPERSNNEKGLELPLEVMAGLGGVPLATRFHNAYILKGRCIAFVPVARNGDSVQWHVLENGQATIRYEDIASLCPVRLPAEILNEEDLLSTRTFLGWCSESMNHLGKPYVQRHGPDCSDNQLHVSR